MSHTTDRDREKLDAKTDVGPGEGAGTTPHTPQVVEFDTEINVRNIVLTGAALVVMALVVHVLMWGLLRGFEKFESRKDVRLTPIEQSSPQQAPPEPRLQSSPNEDLRLMRAQEDELLNQAGWANQQQGSVRVPIDVAIDVITARGVAPLAGAAGAAGAAQNAQPTAMNQAPQTGQGQAATPPAQ